GLAGQYRVAALQRLCTRLEQQSDDRASSYCSAWAKADPGSALASKRAQEAASRMSARKAKAKPAAADSLESAPAKASERRASEVLKE
ncbi:MAG TPA: hypothetical protein VND93_17830, partial [Myxococcales bacterium]|nr:hypothetical protein [Myxococcales bacterium]